MARRQGALLLPEALFPASVLLGVTGKGRQLTTQLVVAAAQAKLAATGLIMATAVKAATALK